MDNNRRGKLPFIDAGIHDDTPQLIGLSDMIDATPGTSQRRFSSVEGADRGGPLIIPGGPVLPHLKEPLTLNVPRVLMTEPEPPGKVKWRVVYRSESELIVLAATRRIQIPFDGFYGFVIVPHMLKQESSGGYVLSEGFTSLEITKPYIQRDSQNRRTDGVYAGSSFDGDPTPWWWSGTRWVPGGFMYVPQSFGTSSPYRPRCNLLLLLDKVSDSDVFPVETAQSANDEYGVVSWYEQYLMEPCLGWLAPHMGRRPRWLLSCAIPRPTISSSASYQMLGGLELAAFGPSGHWVSGRFGMLWLERGPHLLTCILPIWTSYQNWQNIVKLLLQPCYYRDDQNQVITTPDCLAYTWYETLEDGTMVRHDEQGEDKMFFSFDLLAYPLPVLTQRQVYGDQAIDPRYGVVPHMREEYYDRTTRRKITTAHFKFQNTTIGSEAQLTAPSPALLMEFYYICDHTDPEVRFFQMTRSRDRREIDASAPNEVISEPWVREVVDTDLGLMNQAVSTSMPILHATYPPTVVSTIPDLCKTHVPMWHLGGGEYVTYCYLALNMGWYDWFGAVHSHISDDIDRFDLLARRYAQGGLPYSGEGIIAAVWVGLDQMEPRKRWRRVA